MNLTFSILWFDDREDYFDSLDLDELKNEVLSWGFNCQILPVTTPEEFEKHQPFETIDIIVVDKNLEGYEEGQNVIAQNSTGFP